MIQSFDSSERFVCLDFIMRVWSQGPEYLQRYADDFTRPLDFKWPQDPNPAKTQQRLDQFRKLGLMAANDPGIAPHVPDLTSLLKSVLAKLEHKSMMVTIVDSKSGEPVQVPVGKFGLQLILRFDIGDARDLPIFPKLLYTIDQGDPSVLQRFLQKRFTMFNGGINVLMWVMDGASGASPERWARIHAEAKQSAFGNAMNFPYPQVKDAHGCCFVLLFSSSPLHYLPL